MKTRFVYQVSARSETELRHCIIVSEDMEKFVFYKKCQPNFDIVTNLYSHRFLRYVFANPTTCNPSLISLTLLQLLT